MDHANTNLADDLSNTSLINARVTATKTLQYSISQLNGIGIVPSDLFQNVKSLEELIIRLSNKYYA